MAKKKTPKPSASPAGKSSSSSSAGVSSPMDVGLLAQIVKLMSANDLNTVDLRDGGKRVILRRGPAVGPVQYAMGPAPSAPQYAPAPSSQPQAAASGPSSAPPDDDANLVPIKSEMVGTFYESSKPGEKPFVRVGSAVVKDETDVCIVEAMKTFNALKASVTGTIAKVLVQNGQTVMFDQPLFLVKPA
jgi:acetyl-CoA carboxylase biotin carboxyl carrier protein